MNTIASTSYRTKFLQATLNQNLRNALVCEKICQVDRSDSKYIYNPYGSQPTATVQAIAGTYSATAYTLTDDTLTVSDEFIYAEHIYDWENLLNNFDLFASRIDEMTYAIATAIDKFVLNNLCDDCTGTYETPAGGFTTVGNINEIMANLIAKVSGYAEAYKGLYLVIENTDVVGFMQAMATNGYSFADAALNNGWMGAYMGVDIYVVRTGTFVTDTLGSTSVVCSGHRLFGVKGVSTYCQPRDVRVEEKGVTGKTGKEVVVYGYVGFAAWVPKRGLTIDITLA